jgi:hypothetical protein
MSEGLKETPSPYVGPREFRYGETLYGRDRESLVLLDLLIAERIVLLYSPSGAGKSSLIRAALTPKLEEEGFTVLSIARVNMVPGGSLTPLNRYTFSLLLSLEEGADAMPNREQLPEQELAHMYVSEYFEHWQLQHSANTPVLIVDQLEGVLC